ncbi:MAG: hypothetical protein P8Y72_15525, partial [Anaerolineales bacterium]
MLKYFLLVLVSALLLISCSVMGGNRQAADSEISKTASNTPTQPTSTQTNTATITATASPTVTPT